MQDAVNLLYTSGKWLSISGLHTVVQLCELSAMLKAEVRRPAICVLVRGAHPLSLRHLALSWNAPLVQQGSHMEEAHVHILEVREA